MKKILIVFGTRPEAIKMCPLVIELKKSKKFETLVCVTGQHRQMLDQVLKSFDVTPNFDLSIMKEGQTLFDITTSILDKMSILLNSVKPDLVFVHGDTSTTFATSLACFYSGVKIAHVEAGLRTYNMRSPFPEEFNRQVVGLLAEFHFAPTENARNNLIKEGKLTENIYVTGNTAIDALKYTVKKDYFHEVFDWVDNRKLLLITAHRRENLGEPMIHMFSAIKRILNEFSDVCAVYPIHLNPVVRETANNVFGSNDSIKLIEPLEVSDFHNFMSKSFIILTDSGGIQEEAPSLGIPVLVMRDTTERPEGVAAGTLKLVGTNEETIYQNLKNLIENEDVYDKMSMSSNPYGDGTASRQIVSIIEKVLT